MVPEDMNSPAIPSFMYPGSENACCTSCLTATGKWEVDWNPCRLVTISAGEEQTSSDFKNGENKRASGGAGEVVTL